MAPRRGGALLGIATDGVATAAEAGPTRVLGLGIVAAYFHSTYSTAAGRQLHLSERAVLLQGGAESCDVAYHPAGDDQFARRVQRAAIDAESRALVAHPSWLHSESLPLAGCWSSWAVPRRYLRRSGWIFGRGVATADGPSGTSAAAVSCCATRARSRSLWLIFAFYYGDCPRSYRCKRESHVQST